LIGLIIIYTFITQRTIAGRHIYALGGNEKAARLSGVKTQKVMFWVYTNMGLLAALAGLVVAGRLNAATPKAGTGFELDAIAACFIGGASASGGVGTVVGTIVGGLVMGVLNNGMSIMGVSVDWQQTIKGLVLLGAVSFDVYTKSRNASR
jgi:putative multiple sugar transport system permease protein